MLSRCARNHENSLTCLTRREEKRNVSIIVVNWNGESLLGNCLGSLFQQTYSRREIILVDNGSTDRSVQFVKENFPDVKLAELSENRGFTGGNLEGAKLAAG